MNNLTKDSKIDEICSKVKELKLITPNEWFLSTGRQGVLWLNASLTFSSSAQSELKKHALFWKQTIQKIIETVFEVKEQTFQDKKEEEETPSIVFVLWGGFAKQNLAPLILKANNEKEQFRIENYQLAIKSSNGKTQESSDKDQTINKEQDEDGKD
ncbi:MAG: hypothetical protein EZS28_054354, partial [Streblomastix strix]